MIKFKNNLGICGQSNVLLTLEVCRFSNVIFQLRDYLYNRHMS